MPEDVMISSPRLSAEERYPLLSRPIDIGGVRLRNRVVHAAMSTHYGKDGRVTEKMINYHASRAAGGCAMIVTEPLGVMNWQPTGPKIRVYDDAEMDGLKQWIAAVEVHDCRLLGQLQDPGRGMHNKGRRSDAFSASALPDDLSWTVPHAMSIAQISDAVEQLAGSARILQRAGFAGLELSAGHGHLFHQFLSPHSNEREDDYGGPLENRARFLVEIIRAIRAATGRPFIIAVKLPGIDGIDGGVGEAEATRITRHVAALGEVDTLTYCQGSHARTLEDHIPDMHWPRAPFDPLIKRLRQAAAGIPVAALGRLVEPVQAEHALADEVGDLVQIGRALVTDPAWVKKAFEGREHETRCCVSCNTCWGQIVEGKSIGCDNNPRVGMADEADWRPTHVKTPKHIVVIGAGVAGLEAAWVAAARGHQVTVLGKGASYGGKLALLARLPGSEQVSSVYDYQVARGTAAGVRYEYGLQADIDTVVSLAPDTVILATGSTQRWPKMLPVAWRDDGLVPDLRACAETLLGHSSHHPGTALIFDADGTAGTYATAELMARIFDRVVIATPRSQIAPDEALVVQQGIHRRMAELGIDIFPYAEPTADSALIDGIVSLRNIFSDRVTDIGDIALFTYSTARKPNDELATPLRERGMDVRLVGDCYAPRALLQATAEGHAAGNSV